MRLNRTYCWMVVTAILTITVTNRICAQSLKEIFRQKETQRKYLLEQIALFAVQIGHVQKTYEIAKKGLTSIGHVKLSDVNLHTAFFDALSQVKPDLLKQCDVDQTKIIAKGIERQEQQAREFVRGKSTWSTEELRYVNRVIDAVAIRKNSLTLNFILNLTSAQFKLSDNERIQRANAITNSLTDLQSFIAAFSSSLKTMHAQRAKELSDVYVAKTLHNLK